MLGTETPVVKQGGYPQSLIDIQGKMITSAYITKMSTEDLFRRWKFRSSKSLHKSTHSLIDNPMFAYKYTEIAYENTIQT